MQRLVSAQRIVDYYDHCWNERFHTGHNSRSRAIHYGLYFSATNDSEEAKLQTNKQIAKLSSIGDKPLRILDAGCGVGGTAVDVATKYPNLEIVGVTLSDQQVQLASEYAAASGVASRVNFANCDYVDTGLPAGSFDIIWAIESLCHIADRRAFFHEARRLLRVGGRLIVADFFRTDRALNEESKSSYRELCDGFVVSDYYDEFLTEVAADLGWRTAQTVLFTKNVLPAISNVPPARPARDSKTSQRNSRPSGVLTLSPAC